MTSPRHTLALATVLLCACAVAPVRVRNRSIDGFYGDLEALIARCYPAATIQRTENGLRFDHGTRLFFVHEPLKTGEWQDAQEVPGPDRGGILGNVRLEEGPYQGAAEVPQSFDKRYFTMLLMAPELPALGGHLRVELWYPPDVSPDFLKEFTRLVDDVGR